MNTFNEDYKNYVQHVENALEEFLPSASTAPAALHEAIRYSVLSGGKRLRGVLVLASAEWAGGTIEQARPLAAAVECIHAYSLIHDDLPAMDDADMRRGKASCHNVFGDAVAILAGDGLQALAFYLASQIENKHAIPAIVADLAQCAGLNGMVLGQAYDILYEGNSDKLTQDDVETIHRNKTGALIRCSVRIGAMAAAADEKKMRDCTLFGDAIGLGFQIVDDLLDIESSPEVLGKATGTDADNSKITYPAVFGVEASRTKAQNCIEQAEAALQNYGTASKQLVAIARFVFDRKR